MPTEQETAPMSADEVPTPRTDKLFDGINARSAFRGFVVPEDIRDLTDHARQLERELAQAKAAGGQAVCQICTGDGSACPYMGMKHPADCIFAAAPTAPGMCLVPERDGNVALNIGAPGNGCELAADAFWKYWRENGETHKHGYYESTWGAINAALRIVGVVRHEWPKAAAKGRAGS